MTDISAPYRHDPFFGHLVSTSPPRTEFISLTSAVTWIAFGCWVEARALYLAFDLANSDQTEVAHSHLSEAVDVLTKLGHGGFFGLRGRYSFAPGMVSAIVPDVTIEPSALLEFQQFDLHIDGLRRGSSLTWPPANMIFCEPSNEAYHHVLVERAGFLAALGSEAATPSGETARPIKRRGRKPGSGSFDDADALLLIEMKKLITDQKASSPHAAAQIVVEQAKGRGTLESRVARLLKKLMKQNN